MTRFTHHLVTGIFAWACFLGSAWAQNDARAVWKKVLSKCAKSDLIGSKVLYLGPSNIAGVGTVLRQKQDGGYGIRWFLKDLSSDADLVIPGKFSDCSGESTTSTSLSAGVILNMLAAPLGVDLGLDLKRASKTTVKVSGWTWDSLKEGNFEATVRKSQTDYAADLTKPKRVLIERALRIQGLTADVEFSRDIAAALNLKYKGPLPGGGDAGAKLKGEWINGTTLRITSESDPYIAGELATYSESGLSGSGARVVPVGKVSDHAAVSLDKPTP
jgi:hypothetical protein